MEGLSAFLSGGHPLPLPLRASPRSGRRSLPLVRASQDGPELNEWDRMELKFGRLLGEDPKLTLAKIMARKSNPDVSYLDVEKLYAKKKNKVDDVMMNLSVNDTDELTSNSPKRRYSMDQKESLKLPKDLKLNLSRPVMSKAVQDSRIDGKNKIDETKLNRLQGGSLKSGPSGVTLRKPTVFQGDDSDSESKLKLKPNLFLKMRKDSNENLSNMTLLKKPELITDSLSLDQANVSHGSVGSTSGEKSHNEIRKPLNLINISDDDTRMDNDVETSSGFQRNGSEITMAMGRTGVPELSLLDDDFHLGLYPNEDSGVEDFDVSFIPLDGKSMGSNSPGSSQAALLGKPQRSDTDDRRISPSVTEGRVNLSNDIKNYTANAGTITSSDEDTGESDWKRVEHVLSSGDKVEVELISCSARGFVASFDPLIGFLPYRNLGAKWKFLAFESWLRKKGLDPSLYRQNLGILGSYKGNDNNVQSNTSKASEEVHKDEDSLPSSTKFEDLLQAYDQEKNMFLSSFIGQRIRVSVILADKHTKRVIFSGRPKEKEELVEKKRNLMVRLSVGDVVKCCIKKFTYFGIFVEVEGVPALVHQSEVSWDTTLDPSSSFKIGQIVDAKVHQLDFALGRIFLSLKEIMPDPLMESLESVVGDSTSLGGTLEAAQADVEWPDVESLIDELQKINQVSSVAKGRFFLTPGLAPTFQVYMAPMFDNKYKLLARFENKVQEILVQTTLDKEQMKSAILTCTNRVG